MIGAALTSPIRKVGLAMFRLFRYYPDYDPRSESATTTKWVRFPGLPPPLFTRRFVEAIVNSFAFFLDVDERSKACATLKYARACVEIDVSKPVPEEVIISLPDGRKYTQKVEVEGNLFYCLRCKIHGHHLSDCRRGKSSKVADYPGRDSSHQEIKNKKHVPRNNASLKATSQGGNDTCTNFNPVQHEWTEVRRKKKGSQVQSGNPNAKNGAPVVISGKDEHLANPQDHNMANKELMNHVPNMGNGTDLSFHRKSKEKDDNQQAVLQRVHETNVVTEQVHKIIEEETLLVEENDSMHQGEGEEMDCDLCLTIVDDQFYCEQLDKTFQDPEEFAEFVGELGYVLKEDSTISIGESEKGHEAPEAIQNSANVSCLQIEDVDPSPVPRSRHKKKKGVRASSRSCPKKKDTNFVWS
ncbi:unnamed protein product [Rhodiola kirilowii]